MHEYSIAYDLYLTARKAAEAHDATRVTKVQVDLGELAMVNPEQVSFLFGVICEDDDLLGGAAIEYRHVATRSRCDCGYEGTERFVCPRCGALPEIVSGREITVTNIEIEVDGE